MNALVAPKPPPAALTRWTRPAEFLVYLVPVGTISPELYDGYVQLLQRHSVIAIRSLTRPGGYAAELSPFRSFAWDGGGSLRFRFVSTTDKIDSFDGEDVHASARAIGVLGICHCPTTPSLPAAYAQFMDSIRHFPGLLVQKCFAFEHQFDLQTVEECAPLSHLVMFPVYHELKEDDSGAGGGDGMSTVSLHLEVVLDTMCVTILMSLESTVRAAMRQHTQTQTQSLLDLGDAAGFLLDTNVEPSSQSQQHGQPLSPFPSRDSGASSSSSNMRSLPSTPTNDRASSAAAGVSSGGGGVASLFVSAEARNRRRLLARQRKLFGDYAVLLCCVPDAIEHYVTAIELLRDEERRSSGAPGDALWLAAALEGYVFCLYQQCQDKFMVEIVEKASEALALYVKAGVSELEIALVEHIGWYYTAVVVQLSAAKGTDKAEEAVWVKRLLWEVVERGIMVFAELPVPRQVRFLIQSASMLEAVGHHRRMALLLHEAVAVLIQRWRPANGLVSMMSPGSQYNLQPQQRLQELHVALRLENVASTRLGMADRMKWEMTSMRRRTRRLRRLHRHKSTKVTLAMAAQDVEPWLILRFHVLRQLITISKMLPDPLLVGKYCIQLLQVLSWCDEIAVATSESGSTVAVDQPQAPFTSSAGLRSAFGTVSRLGLHTRTSGSGGSGNNSFTGVYGTPPASIEVKTKRYFSMANSPSATMSSAAATITSTIANTPRTLLATPRQQLSAAVSAISTKASPSFSSFSNNHHSSPSSVSSLASTPSSSLPSRSSSATAAELLNGVGGGATANGATRNSFTDGDQLKLDAMAAGINGTSVSTPSDVLGSQSLVWDLRSRAEIQRLQRRVLGILESECVVMRPTEQVKLGSFVRVHKMRVLFDSNRHPVLRPDAALKKCGVSSSSNGASAASPAFFYNPFDKSKPSDANGKVRKPQNQSSDSEDDSDEEADPGDSEYERCFPVHERVRVEVVLSNPIGVELDVQQVIVWISMAQNGSDTLTTAATAAIEAYPSSVVLKPYERRKRIVLAMRSLRPGSFKIVGCYLKVLNIKTSFTLPKPQQLVIVEALPLLSVSLAEIGSLSEETATEDNLLKPPKEGSELDDVAVSKTITDPICMYANETKRCVLHVRNTGQRAVRSFHVMLRAGKAGASLARGHARTVFSSLGGDCDPASGVPLHFETEGVTFKCLVGVETLASLLPLQHGDQLAIPFEVSLRTLTKPMPSNSSESRRDQLQWTLLYSADADPVSTPATETIREYFRESQNVVTLVSLGSLLLHSVQIVSKSSTVISHTGGSHCDDHDNCRVLVEVVNPTETVFVLRFRKALADRDSETSTDWDIEIGRQSSRCLVIELPRVETPTVSSLAETLNARLELQWKTYFGTTGRLFFQDSLWSESEVVESCKSLRQPELHTVIEAVSGLQVADSTDSSRRDECLATQKHFEPGFPFRFYQPANPIESAVTASEWTARLFEACVVEFTVRLRRGSIFKSVDAQIVVRRGSEADEREASAVANRDDRHELSDAVLLSGQTSRRLEVSVAVSAAQDAYVEWRWRVACVFLSEGSFDVAARCAGVSTPRDEEEAADVADRDDVWCHRPLRIRSVR